MSAFSFDPRNKTFAKTNCFIEQIVPDSQQRRFQLRYVLRLPWASIIGWTGGQVPHFLKWGDVMCFVPPPLFGATNIYYV